MADSNGFRRDVIAIGASAGGVEALQKLVSEFSPRLAATVLIVQHIWAEGESYLPRILSKAGPLLAAHPQDGEIPAPAHIYVAPPDLHLMIEDGRMRLVRGPKENMHRPSVDVLFRTAAGCFGPRVVGVLLTGYGGDGAAGLAAIDRRRGVTIVQDPEESRAPGMPEAALRLMKPDYRLRIAQIAPLLNKMVEETARVAAPNPGAPCVPEGGELMENEVNLSYAENEPPSGFVCPECGGALWERDEDGALKFRCRIGHAYSPDSLVNAENEAVEGALWSAVRSLEESAAIARRVGRAVSAFAPEFETKAQQRLRDAEIIRGLLSRSTSG